MVAGSCSSYGDTYADHSEDRCGHFFGVVLGSHFGTMFFWDKVGTKLGSIGKLVVNVGIMMGY